LKIKDDGYNFIFELCRKMFISVCTSKILPQVNGTPASAGAFGT